MVHSFLWQRLFEVSAAVVYDSHTLTEVGLQSKMDTAEKVQIEDEQTPGDAENKDVPDSTTNQMVNASKTWMSPTHSHLCKVTVAPGCLVLIASFVLMQKDDRGVRLHEEHLQGGEDIAGEEAMSKEQVVAEVVVESDQQAQEMVTENELKSPKEEREGEDEREEVKREQQPEHKVKDEDKEETARDSERVDEDGAKRKVKEIIQEESTTATSDTQDTEPQASHKPDDPKSREATRSQGSQRGTSSKERRRDKKKKKSKGVPKLRRRSSQAEKSTIQYLNAIFFSYFQPLDTTGSGFVPADTFWDVSPVYSLPSAWSEVVLTVSLSPFFCQLLIINTNKFLQLYDFLIELCRFFFFTPFQASMTWH